MRDRTSYYDFDAVISVGCRVNSVRAAQLCEWTTQGLREFAINGRVLESTRRFFRIEAPDQVGARDAS